MFESRPVSGRDVGVPWSGGASRPAAATARAAARAGLVWLALATAAAAQTIEPQYYASLVANSGPDVTAQDLASLMAGKLIKGGSSNVLDAKFFFQNCCGYGMLNAVSAALGNTVAMVGGSAAGGYRGLADAYEPADSRLPSYWTAALVPALQKDQTVSQALTDAARNDQAGPNGTGIDAGKETPKSVSSKGGDSIQLAEPAAKSYHAILWAGQPNGNDMQNISMMRNTLISAWGDPATHSNVTITSLYGDGNDAPAGWNSQAATLANLMRTINNLPLNPNEEFLFYSADHGSATQVLQNLTDPAKVVPANGGMVTETFTNDPDLLTAIQLGETTTPSLMMTYSGASSDTSVSIRNDDTGAVTPLGYLDPTQNAMTFSVPVSALGSSDDLLMTNSGASDVAVTSQVLESGDLANAAGAAAPEPSAMGLAATGGLIVLAARWYRLRRTAS